MAIATPIMGLVYEHPSITKQRLRQQLSSLIGRLIQALDDIDGDPDFEDGADEEPSLSASLPTLSYEGSQDLWLQGADDEREYQCEDEGSEHDGREPDECLEVVETAPFVMNQVEAH